MDPLAVEDVSVVDRESDDERLVALGRAGDEAAQRAIYERYASAVHTICRGFLGDAAAAEDAVQETFLRGFEGLDRLEAPCRLGAWLGQIARNVCIDMLRSRTPTPFRDATFVERMSAEDIGPDDVVERHVRQQEVRAVLGRLKPRDSTMLVQHHGEDVSVSELADALGLTYGAMRTALHRARGRFRDACGGTTLLGVPVFAWLRRPLRWLQASRDAAVLAAPSVLVAVVTVAVLVPPPLATGTATASYDVGDGAGARAAGADDGPTPVTQQPAAVKEAHETSVRPGAGADPEPREQTHQTSPTVQHDAVTVPATDVRIDQQPPDRDPDHEYGVDTEVAGQPVQVANKSYDEDDTADVDRGACQAARATDVTYCRTAESGDGAP